MLNNFLCIDIGTKMGWSIYNNGSILSGSYNLKEKSKENKGKRYLNLIHWLDKQNVNHIFYEDVKAHKGTYAAHTYGGFLAIILAYAENNSIPVIGVPVGTTKKHTTGKGNANKDLMIQAMKAKGHNPKDDNEADALSIMYYIKDTRNVT